MYTYLVKLQDMLSNPAIQMAMKVNRVFGSMDQMQQRTLGGMYRGWQKVAGLFKSSTGEAAKLKKEIASLNAYRNFHFEVDSTEWVQAGKRMDELSAKLRHLKSATDGGSGGGRGFFGKMATGMAAMSGGMLGALAMSGNPFLMAAGATGQMAQQAASSTIAPAMTRQMQEFQLGFQLGDQQAGKQLSEQIKKLAIDNPFLSAQDAFKNTPSLLTAGFKSNEIVDKLNLITNLSAMSGKSFDEIALQYKQIKMNGIAQWEELGQMADKLPVMEQLMKLTGAKDIISLRKMIEDRRVTFGMVDKALGNIRGAKDFGQLASNQTQGRFNSLVDQFNERLIGIGQRALPMVNKALEFMTDWLDKIAPFGSAIVRLGEAFSPLFQSIGTILKALGVLDEQSQISANYISGLAKLIEWLSIPIEGLSRMIRDIVNLFLGDGIVGKAFQALIPGLKLLKVANASARASESVVSTDALGQYYNARDGVDATTTTLGKSSSSKSLGEAAGLSSTVEGARKQTTIINIGKFLDKIEMHVANLNEGVSMTETQLMDMMLRVANGAAAVS